MRTVYRRALLLCACCAGVLPASAQTPDWAKINPETLRNFQALVQIDSTDPPGNETHVAEYVKKVLEAEGIPVTLAAKDPVRANVIARLKGNGSKRPLLIMGHSDTVQVDPAKWIFPPFSARLDGGYVYGRGTLDVIFVSEVGEEASTGPGIEYLVNERWNEIDAEICLAESGGVHRRDGKLVYATVETTEKQPKGAVLLSRGPAGHGSRPLRTNAVVHLAQAVSTIAAWEPPTKFNDTTRAYFEKLAGVSDPQSAQRYKDLFIPAKAAAAREYLAEHEPAAYSMLHTSISPNILQAGYQVNVIPSEARATLDIRALPGEDIEAFYAMMRTIINDPAVELVPETRNQRPGAAPSSISNDAYHAVEAAYRKIYGVPTLPVMQTGATDMAFLRAKGVQCYGVGAMTDEEDAGKGFGPHSDQERILEEAIYKHTAFFWDAVTSIAGKH